MLTIIRLSCQLFFDALCFNLEKDLSREKGDLDIYFFPLYFSNEWSSVYALSMISIIIRSRESFSSICNLIQLLTMHADNRPTTPI